MLHFGAEKTTWGWENDVGGWNSETSLDESILGDVNLKLKERYVVQLFSQIWPVEGGERGAAGRRSSEVDSWLSIFLMKMSSVYISIVLVDVVDVFL